MPLRQITHSSLQESERALRAPHPSRTRHHLLASPEASAFLLQDLSYADPRRILRRRIRRLFPLVAPPERDVLPPFPRPQVTLSRLYTFWCLCDIIACVVCERLIYRARFRLADNRVEGWNSVE